MKKVFLSLLMAFASGVLLAANTITTVSQVTEEVTLSGNVDYVITSKTPFTTGGVVNITNVEHAVVIVENIKPSAVISSWLRYVKIDGKAAVNRSNCQVRMYAHGAIILPYASNIKPLTVFAEQNFGGASCDDFGLENTGGYMNTLSEEKLNNQIRSFKLKRGYMVTFSTRKEGRGYSRCFIADKEDLEVKTLPTVLDQTISSYRVFQWYNAPKKGLASNTNASDNAKVNASWCYDWAEGHDMLPDIECVPNHIYEDWPSSASCGSVTYSCHMKTNNEPANNDDDHPQDVATVLANWENLMRTGLRLCSPATHDGGWGWHNEFMTAIDERGWRCDIVDFHGYWDGEWNSLGWRIDTYAFGRPVWFSEWVWGASWNNNGAFNVSNRDDYEGNWDRTYNGTKPILDILNANSRVERYAYWNGERDCSKILKNGQLSKLGEYYAAMNPGLGYNKANEFIPRTPKMYSPSNLSATYDKEKHQVLLKWHEFNGEYNASMEIQRKKPSGNTWNTVKSIKLEEQEADYEETVDGADGYKYRIRVLDVKNTERLSNEATAVNEHLEAGDEVSLSDNVMYLGGNRLPNGSFDFGLMGWTNGLHESLSAPYYQAMPCGGVDDGPYLQCYGSCDKIKDAASVSLRLDIEKNASYYVGAAGRDNDPKNQKISTTYLESIELYSRVTLPAVTEWSRQGAVFTVTSDTILLINLKALAGIAQFDDFKVCRLFETQAEALEDALYWSRERAKMFVQYNQYVSWLNDEIESVSSTATSSAEIEGAVDDALQVIRKQTEWNKLVTNLRVLVNYGLSGSTEASALLETISNPLTVKQWLSAYTAMSQLVENGFNYIIASGSVLNPTITSQSDWAMKVGSYTAGDQRTATQAGKSCWNAWWSTPAGDGTATMQIRQQIENLPHGLYALECKGTTQHLCETDQHGYLVYGDDTLCTEPISYGCLDLSYVEDAKKWNQLSTSYFYLKDKETIEIGFVGSKSGAKDQTWMPYASPTGKGDNREGWWCATDFNLRYIPLFARQTDESGWGTICLPYIFKPAEGVTLYRVVGQYNGEICIEPIEGETVAGTPYLYKCAPGQWATFFESKEKSVVAAKTNVNGLRGALAVTSSYPAGCLVLQNGAWSYIVDRANSFPIDTYSAYVYKTANLPLLTSWEGESLPVDSQAGLGISVIENNVDTSSPAFNLSGQPTEAAEGLVIRNGKVIFVK